MSYDWMYITYVLHTYLRGKDPLEAPVLLCERVEAACTSLKRGMAT